MKTQGPIKARCISYYIVDTDRVAHIGERKREKEIRIKCKSEN